MTKEQVTEVIRRLVNEISGLSGNYSGYEIFTDWIKASAIALSNQTDIIHDRVWKEREEEYMAIVKKHGVKAIKTFANMTGMLTIALEEDMRDVLGEIYMRANLGSKHTGQFFTPFHISYMVAQSMEFDGSPVKLNEPSAGGGGMIIAAAKVMKERGFNYQSLLTVTAQDLDWKGVYMTYLQLSILGIKAKVIQGDTLAAEVPEKRQIFYTPKWKGMLY